ncbi:hypothetical protein [Nocardia sienata]|uniref:hypothetical protein n=1 Tax=Nocardia sienata TaxID=248552 RepID=UPI0007A51ED7|nr:hypothetical protein [Nocardia sienata]
MSGEHGTAPRIESGSDSVMGERHQLINLAYRLLGSLADAEDVVPGLAIQTNRTITSVVAFDLADNRIARVWAVRNPDKLRNWITADSIHSQPTMVVASPKMLDCNGSR